ncbi:MAG: hypothetical protein KGS61_00455, partial [Verrucomicrobia bacterium]|nr:hypothetical protein [Verrucomicrobiota bacterium]
SPSLGWMQSDPPPRSEGMLKLFLSAFVIAVFAYVSFFSCDAFLRTRYGPWQVTFESDAAGTPAIVINEPKVGVTNVKMIFSGEKVAERQMATDVALNIPRKPVPFGKVIFDDLMYQPGNVTFDLFGHEIQLLPRALTVNKKEIPWRANTTLTLSPKDKLPTPPREQK